VGDPPRVAAPNTLTIAAVATLARRAASKPPGVLLRRAAAELRTESDRLLAPRFDRMRERTLLRLLRSPSVDAVWTRALDRPTPFRLDPPTLARIDEVCPGERARVAAAAELAVTREVDLLGSGPVRLGTPIDWHCDVKVGRRWPLAYGRRLSYVDPADASDVKVPWEISRLHWLLPAGQAYVLTRDERYAYAVREILEEWIGANPFGLGVNWAIAMEPAFRIVSWAWLFAACGRSDAWSDRGFRLRFLRALFLHAVYVHRHIERADVNGNHYTADAAALVVAGHVLGPARLPQRWSARGWRILNDELPRQVHADGVDFEASAAYHRLVCELFLLPALYRLAAGAEVPAAYRSRLAAMARFTAAYTKPDGSAPLWGDSDDARVLPLGECKPGNHSYLPALVELGLGDREAVLPGSRSETFWLLGADAAQHVVQGRRESRSAAFPDGCVFVLGEGDSHVFVDAGPVGLAGRGGHGHNDCLSFEAVVDGTPLVTDCGAYVYTASFEWRNRFRSTAFHNTPNVDDLEQNRIDPHSLWRLEEDARPEVLWWEVEATTSRLRAVHHGYERLDDPVTVERTFTWDGPTRSLSVTDRFTAARPHRIEIPFHLAPGVSAEEEAHGRWLLRSGDREFVFAFADSGEWTMHKSEGWASPSYGIKQAIVRLALIREGLAATATIVLAARAGLDEALKAHGAA
jgi:uncharacterized heparinase superfamily protein